MDIAAEYQKELEDGLARALKENDTLEIWSYRRDLANFATMSAEKQLAWAQRMHRLNKKCEESCQRLFTELEQPGANPFVIMTQHLLDDLCDE